MHHAMPSQQTPFTMPRIEVRMRSKVFDKRLGIKKTRNLFLDCQLTSGMLACHSLEVRACAYLAQASEAPCQVILCGDERHVLLYRHAGSLRLGSPIAAPFLP